MRKITFGGDPTIRVDPDEAAIEETRRLLEGYMPFKPDPDGRACDMRATIDVVEGSDMPEWAKNLAIWALFQQTKKRRGKPTMGGRDMAIQIAKRRLIARGYTPTRNDATRDRASASSIIHQALRRLGVRMEEKRINAVVLK
jgi:hypothetical protein